MWGADWLVYYRDAAVPDNLQWAREYWKPSSPRRDLEKAVALIPDAVTAGQPLVRCRKGLWPDASGWRRCLARLPGEKRVTPDTGVSEEITLLI